MKTTRRITTKNPGELHEASIVYQETQMIFPELLTILTGGARVIPLRIFSKWLDPFITDYWTVPRILKAKDMDFEKDCKEVDGVVGDDRRDEKERVKSRNYKRHAPKWMQEQDAKLLKLVKKNKGFVKMLKKEKKRLLGKFRAREDVSERVSIANEMGNDCGRENLIGWIGRKNQSKSKS